MLGTALKGEIATLIRDGQFDELREYLVSMPDVADIAEVIEDLDDEDGAIAFRLLPTDLSFEVFEQLDPELQEHLISHLSRERVSQILNEMAPDDRIRLFEELPGTVAKRLLRSLNPEQLRITRILMAYPEDSIGRRMTPQFISVYRESSVQEALNTIRRNASEAETINVIYVLDDQGRLVDDLRIQQLLLAELDMKIADLCDEQVVSLLAEDDQEEAIDAFKKYDRVALPVTDRSGVMLGIVTVDDVLDVAEEEETEDAHRFGGQEALEDSYFDTSMLSLARKRGGWLILLLVGSFLTVSIMDYFGTALGAMPVLAFFVTMIISTGGNSGTQSAALIIRGIAVREMELGQWWKVASRELLVGLSMGVLLGTLAGLYSFTVQEGDPVELFTAETSHVNPGEEELSEAAEPIVAQATAQTDAALYAPPLRLALLVLLSVTSVVTFGTLIGSLLPFFFKWIGLDPAVCSGPFIATFVDVLGISAYFLLAKFLMGL